MSKSTSAGNRPHPDLGCNAFQFFCTKATFLSVEAALTRPPRFFLIFLTFFPLAAHTEQRQQPALEPFDVPLGRMCWTTTYSDAFFLSHRRFKRGTLWENKLWAAFPLRQPHNSLPVCGRASQRTRRLARKISLHLLTHTMALGWLPEVTHWLTFSVDCLITLEIKQVRLH